MNTAIALLLQAATSILMGVGQNAKLSYAVREQAVIVAEHAIQMATQAEVMPHIGFSVPKNTNIWPTAGDLMQSAYHAADGSWVPLGKNVQLVPSSISFGDINSDGVDDAVAVVTQTASDGSSRYALAAMLNQDNILFNIADLPLGTGVQVFSHSIQNNQIAIDMKIGDAAEQTYHYELLGNQLMAL
jgi:hypothetical protein